MIVSFQLSVMRVERFAWLMVAREPGREIVSAFPSAIWNVA